jgi:hypothetical protein
VLRQAGVLHVDRPECSLMVRTAEAVSESVTSASLPSRNYAAHDPWQMRSSLLMNSLVGASTTRLIHGK